MHYSNEFIMGGHVDCYIDLNSIYSYFAFVHLVQHQETLRSHKVDIDFHVVYLPALQQQSGNRVIWTVKARQHWLEQYELPRSKKDFGVPEAAPPGGDLNNLFGFGQTSLPLRALLAIKRAFPTDVFVAALYWLYHCFWTPPQQQIKDEGPLRQALIEMPTKFTGKIEDGMGRQFSSSEVERVLKMAEGSEIKERLRKNTDDALKSGGFGAPWMLVRNEAGLVEPFFGSDRFSQIYEFLGLPFRPLELFARSESSDSKL